MMVMRDISKERKVMHEEVFIVPKWWHCYRYFFYVWCHSCLSYCSFTPLLYSSPCPCQYSFRCHLSGLLWFCQRCQRCGGELGVPTSCSTFFGQFVCGAPSVREVTWGALLKTSWTLHISHLCRVRGLPL